MLVFCAFGGGYILTISIHTKALMSFRHLLERRFLQRCVLLGVLFFMKIICSD